MEDPIIFTWLNDFGFCPVSIYFHNLYGEKNRLLYQGNQQINGTAAHESIDNGKYSTKRNILQGTAVYSEKYNITGKIDLYDIGKGELTERKKKITTLFDGYIFQLYGQYFALKEMGYDVKSISLYSYDDNKKYPIPLPEEDGLMFSKFLQRLEDISNFELANFKQTNIDKCSNCIYEPICDSSLLG